MKQITYIFKSSLSTFLMFFVTVVAFGQNSITIYPAHTVAESSVGDNIAIRSSSPYAGIHGTRYGGSFEAKTAVLSNDPLFRIGAGGYYSPINYYFEKASIIFKASQNWTSSGAGSKITFLTTANNNNVAAERMVIDNNGNVSIGFTIPDAKLHILHNSSGATPHLHLESNGTNSSILKASSTTGNSWENHFLSGSTAGTNLVYWTNSANSATPLILTGEGDALIERNTSIGGFTSLGGNTAPKIKMKELSATTSPTAGGVAIVNHGLTQAKILSVSILVNASSGKDFPPSFESSTTPGFQYFYHITSGAIVVENSNGNHANIAGRPARILITYKE
ncbi:hypothetical protein [Emticicia soli]|uniref:Uncharacterized protein n=1 Tax=Emticicia soli TaxID=2027878 RepID=A0ABW5J2G9_9BACT